MTRNPKKIRQRLNAGACNLEGTGFKQMSKRQQRKITEFCLKLAQENGDAPRMVTQSSRTMHSTFHRSVELVASIESMAEA